MYFLLPIGHEKDEVRRLPWVTIVLAVACIVAHLVSGVVGRSAEREAETALRDALGYWAEHPYLEPPEELTPYVELLTEEVEASVAVAQIDGGGDDGYDQGTESDQQDDYADELDDQPSDYDDGAGADVGDVNAVTEETGSQAPSAATQRRQGEKLAELTTAWIEIRDRSPSRRWGLVPAKGAAPGILNYMFLHGGWGHLIGNLLFLWFIGPPLEDVWGRPFFGAFYVGSGLLAGFFWVLRYPDSTVPLVGASGAIAALMGAFAVRFWSARIKFFYALPGRVGTFMTPAWVMLGMWFFGELFSATAIGEYGAALGGTAYWVHVWGFGIGLGVAGALKMTGFERRILRAGLEKKLGEHSNLVLEEALEWQAKGNPKKAWELLAAEVARRPDDIDATLALWDVGSALGRQKDAAPHLLRLIRQELRGREPELGLRHWDELVTACPDLRPDVDLRLRVVEAMWNQGRPSDAGEMLLPLVADAATVWPPGTLVRAARLAVEVNLPGAAALCGRALATPGLPEPTRQELQRLAERVQLAPSRGVDTAIEDDASDTLPDGVPDLGPILVSMAPARQPAAVEPAAVFAALPSLPPPLAHLPAESVAASALAIAPPPVLEAGRLEVMRGVPQRLFADRRIALAIDGQGDRVLPLANVRAIAAGHIESPQRCVVVDLLIDAPTTPRPRVRTVRLRSTDFDPAALIPGLGSVDPMAAFVRELLAGSGAVPLPDGETLRAARLPSFATERDYERGAIGL